MGALFHSLKLFRAIRGVERSGYSNRTVTCWHNHFSAIQAVDQVVRLLLGFLGARNTMVLLVSSYKYVCMLF